MARPSSSCLRSRCSAGRRKGAGRARVHAAVVEAEYIDLILSGVKVIESRLSRNRVPPFGVIEAGDRIYFKQQGGPVRAAAVVSEVIFFADLTPPFVRELRRRYNHGIHAPSEYWGARAAARFATLIWLDDICRVTRPVDLPRFHGAAWRMLGGGRS